MVAILKHDDILDLFHKVVHNENVFKNISNDFPVSWGTSSVDIRPLLSQETIGQDS